MACPELIIFDCDGVLIDSELLSCENLIKNFAREFGIVMTLEEVMTRYLGKSGNHLIADLERRYGVPLTDDYLRKSRSDLAKKFEEELQAIPGIIQLLNGIDTKKCVASGSSPERLRHSLGLVGLWDRFAPHVYSATQVKNGKPAPDLFLFAAAQMGVDPSRCLVIEDSPAGVQAARAAHMRVYGFAGGSHCEEGYADGLAREGADLVFDHMHDVAAALADMRQEAAHG